MFYYPNIDEIKNKLKGYSPKSFTDKQELLNYIGSHIFKIYKKNPIYDYITDNYYDWDESFEKQSFTEHMLCDAYSVWRKIKDNSVVYIEDMNGGDDNPMEYICAILDDSTKEYTLVKLSGLYSSWDSCEFDYLSQVELKEVLTITFKDI